MRCIRAIDKARSNLPVNANAIQERRFSGHCGTSHLCHLRTKFGQEAPSSAHRGYIPFAAPYSCHIGLGERDGFRRYRRRGHE
jgi:hypothetical protein